VAGKVGKGHYTQTGKWRGELRKALLKRDGGRCRLCGHPGIAGKGKGLQGHHVQSRAKGGPDTLENSVLLCPTCHGRMRD
jgi:5-methylcytosine-specific restriction endonuclease McrA